MIDVPDPKEFEPQKDHALRVWRRGDAFGHEQDGDQRKSDRPWLILSDEQVNRRRIFQAVVMTSAKRRERRDHLVKNSGSYVDGQQLWTFREERVRRDTEKPPPVIAPGTPTDTRDWLGEYLGFFLGPRSTDHGHLCQGQVVGMRLSPRTTHSPTAKVWRHAQLRRTEAEDLQDGVHRARGGEVTEFARRVFPAVVVTNDRFLRPNVDYNNSSLYSVVTVVPLVHDPRLLGKGAPRVHLGDREYAPVTQYLMTLDYEWKFARKHPRVLHVIPGFERQVVDDDTRASILGEVHEFLDIPSPEDT